MQTIVIVGATSTIAKECVYLWLKKIPKRLILVWRNNHKLEKLCNNLQIRYPKSEVKYICTDFSNHESITSCVTDICKTQKIDIVLIAHGSNLSQERSQSNLGDCYASLNINALSPVLFAEAFAHNFAKVNAGTIAVISSVAGERGRKTNYTYGAAKALLSTYCEGLQHRFYKSNVSIVIIKPGPTATAFTEALQKSKLKFASSKLVAKQIINGISKKKLVIYTPRKWALIMGILRLLPKNIFFRLNI